MKAKKILALLLAILLIAAVAACGGGGGDDTAGGGGGSTPSGGGSSTPSGGGSSTPSGSGPSHGDTNDPGFASTSGRDTLTIAVTRDLGTLSPAHLMGSDYNQVMRNVQEPVWSVMFDGEIIMILATHYEEVTPTQWTIHLRDDVYFSNGSKFTAHDWVFSLGVWRDAGVSGAGRIQNLNIDATKAINDYTIELHWDNYRWDHVNTIADLLVYDSKTYTPEQASGNPIGTGPYVVTDYVINSHVFMERRDDYWGELPDIKYMNFRVLAETSQRVNALETGMVDIAPIAAYDAAYVESLPGLTVRDRIAGLWIHVGLNPTPGRTLNNVEARYAIAAAIDKQPISDLIYYGKANVMNGPASVACHDWLPKYENGHETYTIGYNLDRAKELANRSGLAGKELLLITNGTPEHVSIAEMIQNMLSQINVTVVIHNYDAAGFQAASREPDQWDMTIAQGFVPTLNYGGALTNFMRYNAVFNVPGSWESAEWFVEYAPNVFFIDDPVARRVVIDEAFERYVTGCLYYSICEFLTSEAMAEDITGPFRQNLDGTPVWKMLKFN